MESGRWFGSPFLITLHCADATLREGAQCLERALWASPGQCQTLTEQRPTGEWALLSAGKKAGHVEKKAAQVLKNSQICCVRLAGSVSSEGQDSPLKGGELQPRVLALGQCHSLCELQEKDQDQSKGTSHHLFLVLEFMPSDCLENSQDLEYTKCFSWAESSPTAQSTST